MLESTQKALKKSAQFEKKAGNKSLAFFLDRVADGELAIVPEVWRGMLTDIHGLPAEVSYMLIDHEKLEEVESIEDCKNIFDQLSHDTDKLKSPSWCEIKDEIKIAVDNWVNGRSVPTSESLTEVFQIEIMIPARDFNDIKRALKKNASLSDPSIRKREYYQEVESRNGQVFFVKFIPINMPIADLDERSFKASWHVFDDFGVYSTYTKDITTDTKISTSHGLFICRLVPDPTYN